MATSKKPSSKIPFDNFVQSVRPDPKNVEPLILLQGYAGESSEPDHFRLYTDEALNNFVDLPEKSVVYCEKNAPEENPQGGCKVWLKQDTVYTYGNPTSANRPKASFLEGDLMSNYRGGAGFVPDPNGPATVITGPCIGITPHCLGATPCIGLTPCVGFTPNTCIGRTPCVGFTPNTCIGTTPCVGITPNTCIGRTPCVGFTPNTCIGKTPCVGFTPNTCIGRTPCVGFTPNTCIGRTPNTCLPTTPCIGRTPCIGTTPCIGRTPGTCLPTTPTHCLGVTPCSNRTQITCIPTTPCIGRTPWGTTPDPCEWGTVYQCLGGTITNVIPPEPCQGGTVYQCLGGTMPNVGTTPQDTTIQERQMGFGGGGVFMPTPTEPVWTPTSPVIHTGLDTGIIRNTIATYTQRFNPYGFVGIWKRM